MKRFVLALLCSLWGAHPVWAQNEFIISNVSKTTNFKFVPLSGERCETAILRALTLLDATKKPQDAFTLYGSLLTARKLYPATASNANRQAFTAYSYASEAALLRYKQLRDKRPMSSIISIVRAKAKLAGMAARAADRSSSRK